MTDPQPATLVLMCGLPGAGKSTLAEAVGGRIGAPVFALDWILGAVVQSGACRSDADFGDLGRRLLLMLAHRQFEAGQSAIIDAPGHEPGWRDPFIELARSDRALVRIVEVQCPDPEIHRARLTGRSRGIPGWHEFNWSHVERMTRQWQPWPAATERLVVSSLDSHDLNTDRVVSYLRSG